MKRVAKLLLGLYFVTLWTYGISSLRLPESLGALPYGVALASLTWLALLCSWTNRIWGFSRQDRWALYATACYVFGSLLSTAGVSDVDYLLVLKVCAFPTLIVLVMVIQHTPAHLRRALIVLGLCGGVLTIYGLYGFLTGATGDPIEHAFMYFGVSYTEATRNGDMQYLIVPFWCLVGALWSGYGIGASVLRRALACILLIGLTAALIMSLVRGIWITIPLTVLFGGVLLRKWTSKAKVVFSAVALLLILAIAGGTVGDWLEDAGVPAARLMSRMHTIVTLQQPEFGGNSNEIRIQLITGSLILGVEHSPFGMGVGQLRYKIDELTGIPSNHAENTYLQVFAEQGWLSFGGLIGIWVLAIGPRLDISLDPADRFLRGTCRLLAVNLCMYSLINELTESLWFWSVLAVCIAVNLRSMETAECEVGNSNGFEDAAAATH